MIELWIEFGRVQYNVWEVFKMFFKHLSLISLLNIYKDLFLA